jgi:hypothetical protein
VKTKKQIKMKTDNKKIQKTISLMNDLKNLEEFSQTIFDFRFEVNITDSKLSRLFEDKIKELENLTDLAIEQQTKVIKDLLN